MAIITILGLFVFAVILAVGLYHVAEDVVVAKETKDKCCGGGCHSNDDKPKE